MFAVKTNPAVLDNSISLQVEEETVNSLTYF